MNLLKSEHPNFYGNWDDLKQFFDLARSPIRTEQRGHALRAWSTYKKQRQIQALQAQNNLENVLTKGGYIRSLTMQVIDLRGANLDGIIVGYADMRGVRLDHASMQDTWMKGTSFQDASLREIKGQNSRVMESNFNYSDLSGANFQGADFSDSSFRETKLVETNLSGSDLSRAVFTAADMNCADISHSRVYGVAAWDINKQGAKQKELLIEATGELVSVDALEMAQFIYLLLNNKNITSAISTIGRKGVLILGRFTPERKKVLDAIREELRTHYNLLPIVFDFERATEKDVTETVKILAGLSRFIIADITDPKSSPLELQATIPNCMVPFVTIIEQGQTPFSMFTDLWKKYENWVLKPLEYPSLEVLISNFKRGVINRALKVEKKLLDSKVINQVDTIKIEDLDELENDDDLSTL